ncbi:MAG TPA: CheR family methyltransferase [Candidatus Limnocylindrales bacterium]
MIATESQLVVIGSSAGGIEALSRLVASLPADFSAPIVIAQHLDPRHPSHLQEILARRTTLPVRVVEERAALEDGVVFVVPSNRLVEISQDGLVVREAKKGAIAPSIDGLFRTAATVFGPGLIAVILTGSGSDGAAGARFVKAAGGCVVIENPATAMFPSMPNSIPSSLVDATGELDAIGQILTELLEAGRVPPEDAESDDRRALLELIHERSGIDFSTYKPATILRRLRGRMNASGQPTVAGYRAHVESDAQEYGRLVNSLLIKVTEFFRDPQFFEYLRDVVLPELIAETRAGQRELRIWSAGCSTGEEAYSLAISVAEVLGDSAIWPEIRIFATDIDLEAIAFARRGIYPPEAMESLPEGIQSRYFMETAAGWEVDKRLRALMVFGEHDLGERAPFPRIDLLLCRNVLIYFARPMQEVALETFAFSLRPGGRLALGPSETVMALPDPFQEESSRLRVYRRLAGIYETRLVRSKTLRRPRQAREFQLDQAIRGTHRDVQRVAESAALADSLLLNLAVGVVVVDPRYYILRINSSARKMLGIHGTAFDQDFIHLADVLPATAIRASIDSALAGRTTTAVFEVEPTNAASETTHFVEATVRPYKVESHAIEGAVVELTEVTRLEQERRTSSRTKQRLAKAIVTNGRLLRANGELTAAVAELRMSNESMLLASEDARSSRDEVENVNEELQATNEELETLNEELTASVEELRVANEDLATRTHELGVQATALEQEKLSSHEERDRLRSILANLGDAVAAVDHEGEIVMSNAAYSRFFGGPKVDVECEDAAGLPIPSDERPRQRLARGECFRMEYAVAQPDGTRRWFEAIAEPLTAGDRTWGGVMTVRDLSDRTMRLSLERLMAAAGHELKTPVAALHGYLQLLERNLPADSPDQARIYAAKALVQTRQIGELLERLFDVNRIRAGRLALVSAPLDLVEVVRSAVDVGVMLPNAPEIRLLPTSGPIMLQGDSVRLEQVFVNLLSNAIEHAPGTSAIDVNVSVSGSNAIVEVCDKGPGIPTDVLPLLFKPYARLGKRAKSGLGLGLGLYLAREIVIAHGGTIKAESTLGEGTVIVVRLPLGQQVA